MPLKGELRDFSTTQLLNLINLAGKTGTLTIFKANKTGEFEEVNGKKREKITAGPERAKVSFRTGKLIYAMMDDQDGNLVSVLNKAGKLTDEQARIIRERAKNTADKALALLLINANYVSQNDVVSCIQQHTLDVVYNLLSWNQEPFRFDDDVLPDNNRIQVPIDLENVIIEGARRIREIEELNQHLPNLDMALKFPENPKEKFKGIHLSVEEWRVVSFVNPKNSIRQIAKANNMSEIEIRRIVYGLEQAGLVELVKPPGMEQSVAAKTTRRPAPAKPQVQKVVVNRLIDKIRSI
ncbi:MAG: DUF4388 domain-containing protein [Chloroflexi bacterium]|nr:DUF4388 domain-containing protein [Chloroflexota bacterium]MDL1885438.1 DUF4388 domain-containing protein [Anaerolineae bacterium CFX8]